MKMVLIGIMLQVILIIGGLISGTSRNIKLVSIAGLLVGISVIGLAWVVWKGDITFLIGIAIGVAIEFLIIRKYVFLQKLQSLQNSE